MPRPATPIDQTTYAARIAARLRALRIEAGLSIEDVQVKLTSLGREVPVATLYAYERGKNAGGVGVPHALLPLIARLYGFARAGDWLPHK